MADLHAGKLLHGWRKNCHLTEELADIDSGDGSKIHKNASFIRLMDLKDSIPSLTLPGLFRNMVLE